MHTLAGITDQSHTYLQASLLAVLGDDALVRGVEADADETGNVIILQLKQLHKKISTAEYINSRAFRNDAKYENITTGLTRHQ